MGIEPVLLIILGLGTGNSSCNGKVNITTKENRTAVSITLSYSLYFHSKLRRSFLSIRRTFPHLNLYWRIPQPTNYPPLEKILYPWLDFLNTDRKAPWFRDSHFRDWYHYYQEWSSARRSWNYYWKEESRYFRAFTGGGLFSSCS